MTTGNLTIQDNDTLRQYTAVGESTFVFDFPILAAAELRVSKNQVVKTYGADYTITGIGDDGGGFITLLGGASTPGDVWSLWQDMPIERLTGFSAGAATILGAALNAEFAARLRVEQQLRREIRNSLRLSPDDPLSGQQMILPTLVARAGKYLAFDANGAPTPASGTGNDAALRADLANAITAGMGGRLVAIQRSQSETNAGLGALSYTEDGGYGRVLSVFRFFTAAEIADVAGGVGVIDVSAKVQAANDYLEGRAPGAIGTFNTLVGGAGYNGGGSGVFDPVDLTGGAGQYASARVTVTAGVITAVSVAGPGQSFLVGNVLNITAANLVIAGAAAGGAGSTVTVATLATGGRREFSGGKLYFPAGAYNMGTTDLRVGDMVNWEGESIQGCRFLWSNAHTGKCVVIGPDKSGFNGRGGYYAMGCGIERIWITCGNLSDWGVYTLGLQQNGKVKDVWVSNVNKSGGVFLKDTAGSSNMLCEDVYVFGGNAMLATVYGFQVNAGANCVLNRCSTNGGNLKLAAGIRWDGGDLKVRDFQCELSITHIDVSATAGQGLLHVDKAVFNLATGGSLRGIWIRAGFVGTVVAIGIDCGPFQVPIQNDNTGYARSSGATTGFVPFYCHSGTAGTISTIEQMVYTDKQGGQLPVNGAGLTVTPDINTGMSFLINVTNVAAFTVGKPTMGALFPGALQAGRHMRLQIYNQAGVMGAITWNAVFKMSAGWANPANNFNKWIEFEFDGNNWYQCQPATADVAN